MTEKENAIREIDELKLEELMRRLDETVERLDGENENLEEMLKLYEEGVRLIAACNKKLADAERKIQILKITPDGEICEEPFENT